MAKLQKTRVHGNLTIDGRLIGDDVNLNSIQVFTTGSAATYTPPVNLKAALVIATGGGGGGGGADGDAGSGSGGGGGGAGATAINLYTGIELGASLLNGRFTRGSATYTIGAGGAGGSGTNGTNGTAGGNTTFDPGFFFGAGPVLTANGGALGTGGGAPAVGSSAAGGAGGSASDGDINISGGGGAGGAGDDVAEMGIGGVGGSSFWGGGGRGAKAQGSQTVAGVTATTFGGGGGGAAYIDQASSIGVAGGAGASGVIFILEFT